MDTRAQIRSFITDTFFVDAFGDSDSFLKTGVLDSMGMMQLVGYLEQHFGVKVADQELVPANLDSLDRVTAFVERKLGKAA